MWSQTKTICNDTKNCLSKKNAISSSCRRLDDASSRSSCTMNAWRRLKSHVVPIAFSVSPNEKKMLVESLTRKKQWWKTNRRSLLGSVIAIYIRYLHGTLVFSWFQHFFAPELGQQELGNIEASTCITAPVLRQTCHMDNSALCPIFFQISLPTDWKRSDY